MKKILIATAFAVLMSTSSFAAGKPVDPATAAANKARIEEAIKKNKERKAAKAAAEEALKKECKANPKLKKCAKVKKKK
jgi:F0F1-type ATP synthase epsilon subunit